MVGLRLKGRTAADLDNSLEELSRLLETAGGQAVAKMTQHRPRPDPATLIGAGKAVEIAELAREKELDLVVFDDELSPGQQRLLQEQIPAKVIDRTRLILDIFAQRARTKEGKLQVELAQLNYLLPRMTERFGRFEQQTGGIGTRGPGERKLEVDRRHIRQRILHIQGEIDRLRGQRALQKENRRRVPLPLVAILGYTNVGKSTLLNALIGGSDRQVYADDKLFATLDPTTRRVKLPGGRVVLFADTVGFIQKLPHHVVAAFHATLEEVSQAQLLLHVADATDPDAPAHAEVVRGVLASLQAEHLPQLLVFNKMDALSPQQRRAFERQGRLLVSAKTGGGIKGMLRQIEEKLEGSLLEKEILLPHTHRRLLPFMYASGRVLWQKPLARGTKLRLRMDAQNWGRLESALRNPSPELINGAKHEDVKRTAK